MIDDHSFALCLTHDVDRPYKRLHHALYYALTDRSFSHVRSLFAGDNPYWQFDDIMSLERDLGVRSAFYFLADESLFDERPSASWLDLDNWIQELGRYDPTTSDVAAVIGRLDCGGWEVGLHGSFDSATDAGRMRAEKARIESVLDHDVRGIRQHYLRLDVPDTWNQQASLGFEYDASLGESDEYGFEFGYRPLQPVDESFVVFPLTLMEQALPDPESNPEAAWRTCSDLLGEAAANEAVMTVLWHPRYFNTNDFPGYRRIYRRLVEDALDADAWVGPPGALLHELHERGRL